MTASNLAPFWSSTMRFAVHDWETTGLTLHAKAALHKQPRAIEFAGIITDGKEIIDTLEFICNPEQEIEPIITKITGLTNEDLDTRPTFRAYAPALTDHFAKADCVISHNLSFDKAIANIEAQHMGLSLADFNWPGREVCSVEQTFPMFGRRMKLSELYELKFGAYQQKHRAMDDLMLLHQCCIAYGIYDAVSRAQA